MIKKDFPPLFWILSLILFLLTSCAPKAITPEPNIQIQQAVAATIAAIPTATPIPTATHYPTPTPLSLAGLFCEYKFCIGHPTDMVLFDVTAQKNPNSPSAYNQGIIAGFSGNLFIQVIWQLSPGAADPQPILDLILEDAIDATTGNQDVKLVHNMNVKYTSITTTATPVLPYGGAGAWVCGDRLFAWKAYTPLADSASPLFEDAIARFACNQN